MKKITLLEERKKFHCEIKKIKEHKFNSELLSEELLFIHFSIFVTGFNFFNILLGGHETIRALIFIFILCGVFLGFVIGISDLIHNIKLKIKLNRSKDTRMFLPHIYTLLFFGIIYFFKPLSFFDLNEYALELFFSGFSFLYFFNYRKFIYSYFSKKMKNKRDKESLNIKIKAIDEEILKDPDLCIYILENEYNKPYCKDIFDNLDPKAYLISHFKTKTTKKENEIETL